MRLKKNIFTSRGYAEIAKIEAIKRLKGINYEKIFIFDSFIICNVIIF